MKKLVAVVIVFCSALILSGCISFNSLADAKNGKGEGEVRNYSAAKGDVWRKAVVIIKESKLDLIAQDSGSGYILAQQPMSPLGLTAGQNIAVFINERAGKTRVEVVGKKAVGNIEFVSRNWEKHILRKLDASLDES